MRLASRKLVIVLGLIVWTAISLGVVLVLPGSVNTPGCAHLVQSSKSCVDELAAANLHIWWTDTVPRLVLLASGPVLIGLAALWRARRTAIVGFGVLTTIGVVVAAIVVLAPFSAFVVVDNRTTSAYLVRVVGGGTSRAWLVAPESAGLLPTRVIGGRPFQVITTLECVEVGRFAFGVGRHTIVIESGGRAPSEVDGIRTNAETLPETIDSCGSAP